VRVVLLSHRFRSSSSDGRALRPSRTGARSPAYLGSSRQPIMRATVRSCVACRPAAWRSHRRCDWSVGGGGGDLRYLSAVEFDGTSAISFARLLRRSNLVAAKNDLRARAPAYHFGVPARKILRRRHILPNNRFSTGDGQGRLRSRQASIDGAVSLPWLGPQIHRHAGVGDDC